MRRLAAGLAIPLLAGCFQTVIPGPDGQMTKIKTPCDHDIWAVTRPSQFTGILDVGFERYSQLQDEAREQDQVTNFDGYTSRVAIARALGFGFTPLPNHAVHIEAWATDLISSWPLADFDSRSSIWPVQAHSESRHARGFARTVIIMACSFLC
jgi:hypothetical protein